MGSDPTKTQEWPQEQSSHLSGTWRREYKEYLPDRTPKSDSCHGVKWMHPTLAFSPNIWIHDIVNSMLLCRLDSKMKVSLESGVQGRLALGASRQHPRHFSVSWVRNGQWEKKAFKSLTFIRLCSIFFSQWGLWDFPIGPVVDSTFQCKRCKFSWLGNLGPTCHRVWPKFVKNKSMGLQEHYLKLQDLYWVFADPSAWVNI